MERVEREAPRGNSPAHFGQCHAMRSDVRAGATVPFEYRLRKGADADRTGRVGAARPRNLLSVTGNDAGAGARVPRVRLLPLVRWAGPGPAGDARTG